MFQSFVTLRMRRLLALMPIQHKKQSFVYNGSSNGGVQQLANTASN